MQIKLRNFVRAKKSFAKKKIGQEKGLESRLKTQVSLSEHRWEKGAIQIFMQTVHSLQS